MIDNLYIEELPSESWKTKPKLLKQPIRRTVYIIICQRELKVKTSKLLREKKKGNEQVANVILHPIGWEDGSSFLGQSTSRVQRNLSNADVFYQSSNSTFSTGVWQSFIVVYSISLLRIRLFYFYASDKLVDSVSRVSKYCFTRHTL